MKTNSRDAGFATGIIAAAGLVAYLTTLVLGGTSDRRLTIKEDGLTTLVSSLDQQHHHLLGSISRYVNRHGITSHSQIIAEAESFGEQFERLAPYYESIANRSAKPGDIEHEASMLKAPIQQDGVAIIADNRVQQTKDMYSHLELSIYTLLQNGKPTMVYVTTLLSWLRSGQYADHFEIRSILDSLGNDINALKSATETHAVHQSQLHESLSKSLNTRLHYAYVCMSLGVALFLALMALYLRYKHQTASDLRTSNDRLVAQIKASGKLAEQLEYRATHDSLSGLYNRAGFTTALEAVLQDHTASHGLCFIDLDMFKIVNDTSGHPAGDELIRLVAAKIRQHTPEEVTVGRFGGDEFLILASAVTQVEFVQLIQVCCDAISPLKFEYEGRRFTISGSFGAVLFNACDYTVHSLITTVDSACYQAKRAGGGRVHFHNENNSAVQERRSDLDWVAKVQDALAADSFCLYYQPIANINSATGKPIHSWEILIRMLDADGQLLTPGKFLDIAERYSLAPRIDRWVVRTAFQWLAANHTLVAHHVDCVNINLSGKSISDKEFLNFIEQQVAQLTAPPSLICFEITETAIAGEHAHATLMRLKQLGFQLALDDFGSGFSSFGYLEALPVDYIKIDGMFVRDIDDNPTHREFVKAINTVGKAMNKLTVAEFVENHRTLQVLTELGVDFAQGYHIAKPQLLPLLIDSPKLHGDNEWQHAA